MSRAVAQIDAADVSQSALTRHAGPIAIVAGGLFAVTHLVLWTLADRSHLDAMLTNPFFRWVNAAYFVAFCGLLIALVAVHAWQARAAGTFGVVGFCAALIGTLNLGGNMWFEGFAAPWLAEVVPQALTAEKTVILQIGGLSSYLLFALGWVLFGLASLRARVFPVAICIAIVVGGVLGFNAAGPPYGAPIGLAIAWLGVWMTRSARKRIAERAV